MALGYGSIYTLLADLRDHFGFSGTQLGLIVAAGFLAGFLAQLFLARLADRGFAGVMVRGGTIAAAFAMLGGAVATRFWAFVLVRVLLGLGSGAVSPAIRSVVITRDPGFVGPNLGRLASFEVAGFVIGPLLAGPTAQALGLRASFLILASVLIAVAGLACWVDLSMGVANKANREGRVLRELFAAPALRAALAAGVSFYVAIGMFEAVWAVLLRDHGAATWLIGLTLSAFTIPMIFLAPIGGREAQRRGPLRVVSVSIAVAAVCTFSYGVLPSLWMILAASLVHAIADSFTMPGNQLAIAVASPPEFASSAQGLLGAVGLFVAGLTGLIGGYGYQHAGRLALFGTTSAVMVTFLAAAVVQSWRATPLAPTPMTSAPVSRGAHT
jgi:MFS family permease